MVLVLQNLQRSVIIDRIESETSMNLPQIIFFDFDNTLIDSKTHAIPASALDALHRLVDKGIKIAIASGRSHFLLKETGALNLVPWSGLCLSNGQVVIKGTEDVIHHHFLPKVGVLNVIETAKSLNMNVYFSTPHGDFMMETANELVFEAHHFFNEPIPLPGVYVDQPIDKLLIYAPKGYDYAPYKAIEGLTTFVSVSTYADIATKGVSKLSAIHELLDDLGLDHRFTAFGDSQNDMEMLQGATISVAMGNADPKLKAIADHITDDVDQDGLWKALVKLGYFETSA